MFGTRDEFNYFCCSGCGSLQLIDNILPDDLARSYGPDYYSYASRQKSAVRRTVGMHRDQAQLLGGERVAFSILSRLHSASIIQIIAELNITRDTRILEVGCGQGELLERLAAVGFTQLTGVDPLVPEDRADKPNFRLIKAYLHELTGDPYDLIMFNHSLEHVPHFVKTLTDAHDRLARGGLCLVRLPTTSSQAWEIYRENWVQIDAPRHCFIPSREAMSMTAGTSGFVLERTIDDSTEFQFSGSERYCRNIPLNDREFHFPKSRVREWRRRATALNAMGRGDQAAFILRKP